MKASDKTKIQIETTVNAPISKVWEYWNGPEHITQWNTGHPDWHTPTASNDLRVGGRLESRMEAKDGSLGFDFGGTYTSVDDQKHLAYTLDDDREVNVTFEETDKGIHIIETFEAESENPVEMQQQGWHGILDNFKRYTESHS